MSKNKIENTVTLPPDFITHGMKAARQDITKPMKQRTRCQLEGTNDCPTKDLDYLPCGQCKHAIKDHKKFIVYTRSSDGFRLKGKPVASETAITTTVVDRDELYECALTHVKGIISFKSQMTDL